MEKMDAMTMKPQTSRSKQLFGTLSGILAESRITPHVELYLGLICNIQCPYCYLPYKKPLEDEMPIDVLLEELGSLGMRTVEVLGGEPFVYRSRLLQLLDFTKRNNVRITAMSSNGLVYDEAVVAKLKESGIGYLQISMDAAKGETYKIVRSNGPGLFDKALGNIQRFVATGIPISMSFVIMRPNMGEVTDFVHLARSLGVHRISFGTVVPIGEGKKVPGWFLTQVEYEKVESEVNSLRAEMKDMEIIFNGANEAHGELCSAGVNKVAVLPNGDIYVCGLFIDMPKYKLGNIRTQLDREKLVKMFEQEEIGSKDYWKRCVACKISVSDRNGQI